MCTPGSGIPVTYGSDAVSRWAGWALADRGFGVSVNPISTTGADYAHRITACPPEFENLTASLYMILSHCYLVSFQQYLFCNTGK